MRTLNACIIATLVATCVATNYVLVGVPNVKFMDFIVFIGGFCFGPLAGALIGILSWAVYGTINPHGFVLQVWLATMLSEPIYGLIGGYLGKNFVSTNFGEQRVRLSVFFGTMGFLLTLVYDLLTTIVYVLTLSLPIIATFAFGAPFTVAHELSNAIIFGAGSIPMITAIRKVIGGQGDGISKK